MFTGMMTALVTPFLTEPTDEPAIDWESWEQLVEWQIEAGADALVLFGTTGESATLTTVEKLELVTRTVTQVNGRVPLIAGTGGNSTRSSVELTKAVRDCGVDGVLAVSPYYNKPTQEGLYQHFSRIADEGGLPVVLYNIPGRAAVALSLETIDRLAAHPQIVGVKQAVDSASELLELSALLEGRAALLAGDDPLVFAVMSLGGQGVISASGSVIPEMMCAIVDAGMRGDLQECRRAQLAALPIIRTLFLETNPAPAKAALKILGKIKSDSLRLPLVPVRESTRAQIAAALEQLR